MKVLNKPAPQLRRGIFAACFAGIALYTFYNLYTILFAVHDDMLMYMITRNGAVATEAVKAAKAGRLPQLWDYFLLAFPFALHQAWFYKAVAYASCLFDVGAMWFFLRRHVDEDFASVCAILVMSFVTISPNHNLFISYAFCHQIPIGLFFLALHSFMQYHKHRKKRDLILCCVLYLVCCMIYETFLMFMLVFGVTACIQNAERSKESFWRYLGRILLELLPPLVTAVGYVIAYKVWQIFYPSHYGGITFYLEEPVYSLKILFDYSMALFPVNAVARISAEYPVGLGDLLGSITIGSVVKSALVTGCVVLLLVTAAPRIRFRGVLAISCFGMFVPNILMGFSQKYVTSAKNGNTAYIPSFYSYFFLVVLLCGFLCLWYRNAKPRNLRMLSLLCMGAFVFSMSLLADYNVDYWKAHYAALDRRYYNFDRCLSTSLVTDCDAAWMIYAPDNPGIHAKEAYNLDYLRIYDDTPAARFVRKAEDLEPDKRILCLRSDEQYQLMTAGEMDSQFRADTLTVVTVVPEAFTVTLHTASGKEVTYSGVTDGTVLQCPEQDAFDMQVRVQVVG